MKLEKSIVITGAAGFIGSCIVAALNERGYDDLILVDDFSRVDKTIHLIGKKYKTKVHREQFFEWLNLHHQSVGNVLHLGAKTDTTLKDKEIFRILNVDYTKRLFEMCAMFNIPFFYASSAATYGNGEFGYNDKEDIFKLKPLNEYAKSKQAIDEWILLQKTQPDHWAGFKFFNVYGPNESHKGRMASVVYHAYQEILKNGCVTLFKSHHPEYNDGEQKRDFVYVKDVAKVLIYFLENKPQNGIFNLGTGKAQTFLDLVNGLFKAIHHNGRINFIETPVSIRDNYQYFTQANIEKLRNAGYKPPFMNLEEGIYDYAINYLESAQQY